MEVGRGMREAEGRPIRTKRTICWDTGVTMFLTWRGQTMILMNFKVFLKSETTIKHLFSKVIHLIIKNNPFSWTKNINKRDTTQTQSTQIIQPTIPLKWTLLLFWKSSQTTSDLSPNSISQTTNESTVLDLQICRNLPPKNKWSWAAFTLGTVIPTSCQQNQRFQTCLWLRRRKNTIWAL